MLRVGSVIKYVCVVKILESQVLNREKGKIKDKVEFRRIESGGPLMYFSVLLLSTLGKESIKCLTTCRTLPFEKVLSESKIPRQATCYCCLS